MRGAPISAFHGRLELIGRERHARRINRIANDPSVYPFVAGRNNGLMDFTFAIQDESNILLMGRYGGFLFSQVWPGIYEVHPMILPEGRGEWSHEMGQCAMFWMFTRTECLEILAPVPEGNRRALAYAKQMGLQPSFTTGPRFPLNGKAMPLVVHSITLQDWLKDAPGVCERGEWVQHELTRFGLRLTTSESPDLYRQIGFAFECFLNGAAPKGVVFHHRWARLAGFEPCRLVSDKPVAVEFAGATIVLQDHGRFYVAGAEKGASLH